MQIAQIERPRRPGRPLRRRWRLLAGAAALLAVAFALLTARFFVWPPEGMPARADAIVMLDGPGDRLSTAVRLAREHRAPVLVVSRGVAYPGQGSYCAPAVPHIRLICFNPSPATTQGEAEFTGRLARRYHWRSVALVTTAAQDTRARLRVGRCFGGEIYVVAAPLPAIQWPYAIAYEWAATIKALVLQRAC